MNTEQAIEKYADTVYRICYLYMKNREDTEDIFQTVFMKHFTYIGTFKSEEHEKAWLIRTSINACKDVLKNFFRKNTAPIEDVDVPFQDKGNYSDVREAVMRLPQNYRNAVYLMYYEGYTAKEISKIIGKNENTVYTWISRAKELLKSDLGGDYLDE